MTKKILKVFLINVFLILIILVLLESGARIFNLSQLMGIEVKIIDDTKKKIHYLKPNSSGKVFGADAFFDFYGYRVPSLNYKYKSEDKIFVIGDSVAFGNGVLENLSFPGIMRKNLKNYEIYNTSVFGYQTKHYNLRLNELDKFQPIKKIFYFVTLNDVFKSSNVIKKEINRENNYDKTKLEKIINLNFIKNLNDNLRDKSYFWMFLKGKLIDPQKVWFTNVLDYYKKNDLKNFNFFINNLKNKSKDLGSELTIFILPYEFQTRNCNSKVLLPQSKIRDILVSSDVEFFDFTRVFCENNNPKKLFYKFDPMHLSEKGHKLVYNEILKEKFK
tara:strand:+ start:710 stop:1702 length:993 start_codon:yes stop_codon:yes gene_type:complete